MNKSGNRVSVRAATAIFSVLLGAAGTAQGQWGMGAPGAGSMGGDLSSADPSRFLFRPWVAAQGNYTEVVGTQQLPGSVRRDFYGYGGTAGISGAKVWERTSVAIFYTANYQRFGGRLAREGMSQVGGVSVSHRVTGRVGLFASQLAGSSLGGFGYGAPAGVLGGWGLAGQALLPESGLLAAPLTDPAANGLVDNEFFGSRVNFYVTSGGVSYQPSLRWSFSAGGQAGYVRRKGRGLRDLDSAGAFGQAAYRLSERTMIGAGYNFGTFSYPKFFGGNRVQVANLFLSHQVSQQTRVTLGVGGYRMDTTFLGAVATDPEIAALLGVPAQLEVQKRHFYGWQGMAAVNRSWRTWGANVSYLHGVNPGNGVVLASRRDSVFGSLSRSFGRLNFGAHGGFFRWSGLLQNARLTSGQAGLSTGLRIKGDLYFGLNGGYSFFDSPTQPRRWQRFASAHLTWSPSGAAFRF